MSWTIVGRSCVESAQSRASKDKIGPARYLFQSSRAGGLIAQHVFVTSTNGTA